jgi:hypothetical protein
MCDRTQSIFWLNAISWAASASTFVHDPVAFSRVDEGMLVFCVGSYWHMLKRTSAGTWPVAFVCETGSGFHVYWESGTEKYVRTVETTYLYPEGVNEIFNGCKGLLLAGALGSWLDVILYSHQR